ncbi:hypothetical protein FG386_000171 [Cryptosporidium ryanae]|uniref:uncharacterized protein n=1 Tax=Cryptosporidium ryanae TaxID=515981 RepID=UPI00351A2B08|nr:hypothetical protein FG386_000171 [Cryptosporidium ryanae]
MHSNVTCFRYFYYNKKKYLLFSDKLYIFIICLLSLNLKHSGCQNNIQYNGYANSQFNPNPYSNFGLDINDNSLSQIGRNLDRAVLPNLISVGNFIESGIQTPTTIPGIPTAGVPSIPGIPTAGVPSIPGIPTAGVPSIPGIPTSGVPSIPGIPTAGVPSIPGIPTAGVPSIPGIPNTIPGIGELSEEIGTEIGDIGNGIGAAIVEIGSNIEDGMNISMMESSDNHSPSKPSSDYGKKDDNLYTLSAMGKGGSKIYTYNRPSIVSSSSGIGSYLGRQPYPYKTSILNSLNKDTNQISQKFPLYLTKSPLMVTTSTSNNGGNGASNTNTSFNYNNGLNQIGITTLTKQEINKGFSPYSSIHYLKASAPQMGEKQSIWKWEHIDKPLLRTNTARPVEFKHNIPASINEAWWNNYKNIRKEPKKVDEDNINNEIGISGNDTKQDMENYFEAQRLNDSKYDEIYHNNSNHHKNHSYKQNYNQNHTLSHIHNHGNSHKRNNQNHKKKQQNDENDDIQENKENVEEGVLKSTTIGDIVNLTRLEIPNPYDRKIAINNLISNSLSNMKQENWSIPVEEIINSTFINPGTEQPNLVPNQMGPKAKIQDFYCNPNIHKCTDLYTVGTSIGEPLWKIYNTSTFGRAQRRIENLLDDTEEYLTMGLTQTFIDYIEQEPTR